MSSITNSSNDSEATLNQTLQLQERLRTIVKQDDPKSWDDAWKASVTPWEKLGDAQPPLRNLLQSNEIDLPRSGRALVPGCGSGYDVALIASTLGIETTGLDISETAVQRAEKLLASKEIPTSNAHFRVGNFFELNPGPDEKYDLVYDYTFFVAIPPSMRGDWAAQMTKLIKPGGYLITLVYPIQAETDVGPPFFVRVEHHEKLLSTKFVKVIDRTPEESAPGHEGKEQLVVWKRLDSV